MKLVIAWICGISAALFVVLGLLFVGCIFFCWLMARARKMFPRVEDMEAK